MLVNQSNRGRSRSDDGAALITVMTVVFVGFVITGVVAAASMFVIQSNTGSRGDVQAIVAAESGRDLVLQSLRANLGSCQADYDEGDPIVEPGDPEFHVEVFYSRAATPPSGAVEATRGCPPPDATFLVLRSTGTGAVSSKTSTIDSVYRLEGDVDVVPGAGHEMVFFSHATMSGEIRVNSANADLISIVVPSGDFTCRTTLPANVFARGSIIGNGSCRVVGDVFGGGALTVNGSDVFESDVTIAGTGVATIQGKILGDIHVGGGINFGWTGFTYPGNVTVGGNVNLASVSIGQHLKIPASASLQRDGWINIAPPATSDARINGGASGGIDWMPSPTPPNVPTFAPWFEFSYKPSEWPAFTNVITLAASGDGPGTCGYFNSNNGDASSPNQRAKGWRDLALLTTPTVIDARACGTLSSNNGTTPNVAIKTDILFLAKQYDLNSLTLTAAVGASPRLWWTVEDPLSNAAPTCTGGAGDIVIEKTSIDTSIISMGYTPCTVRVTGSTLVSKWRGSFYGGGFSYGGGLTFTGDPGIGLPGMPTGTVGGGGGGEAPGLKSIRELVLQRDVG